jgi:tetratricopeptide (TPR) repeat protein
LRQRVLELRQRLEQGRLQTEQRRTLRLRQEKLLRALDEARQRLATSLEATFDYAGAAAQNQKAFAGYGLAVQPGRTAKLARRIRAEEPAVREALLVALDDWVFVARRALPKTSVSVLRELAEAADDDVWRKRHRAASAAGDRATLLDLSAQARKLSLPPSSLVRLALSLSAAGERDEALALLRWARGRHPTDFWTAMQLGNLLGRGQEQNPVPVDLEESIGCFRVAVALRPDASAAHYNLGNALQAKGQLDDAIEAYRTAFAIDPRDAPAHNNLGLALWAKGQRDDAIAEYRKAIAIDPSFAPAHSNLGSALQAKGQLDDAIEAHRKAIDIAPRYAKAHNNLGNALRAKGQLDDAIAEFRKAIEIDPRNALAHTNLGVALWDTGQREEAIAALRKAIKIDPRNALAYNNLGLALWDTGQREEAIAAYCKAIEIDPRNALAHTNLGNALRAKGQLDDAIEAYRKAIAIDPKEAKFHWNLGEALLRKGRFAEAKTSTQTALKLLARDDALQPIVSRQLQQCQTLLALEAKLPDVLAGKVQPADQRERLGFLEVCRLQQRHAAFATLAAAAFAADAGLADDLKAGHRYNAACAAALAGCGAGKDADKLEGKERAHLRR